jgi:UDP-N-acetylmuramoyl-L-alanyl-D-glutamate--2,6-diaminopimelate ligase
VTTASPPSTDPPRKALALLLKGLFGHEVRGDERVFVTDVVHRSQDVRPGALFFCVPGGRADGHGFAAQAERAGATALVVERWLDVAIPQVRVPWVRGAMGPVSAAFFDQPSLGLTVAGVTGTNGKTTTTYLLESIFRAAGMKAGVIGTTGVRVGGRALRFDRTTPEAPDLQRLLARMRDEAVQAVAMEVSSHGLDQHRVDGAVYACSIFTNLSQDHLDYHGTMDAYFQAKARLFTPDLTRRAVINGDVPEGRRLAERSRVPRVTFGLRVGSDVVASDVEVLSSGVSFTADNLKIRSHLRGTFNVSNCLGAFVAGRELGIEGASIVEGIAGLSGVPGRLEPVELGQPFMVLVDYAHTPDSLKNVARTGRELSRGRLIVVFGCGGDRDRGKRPLMGEAATRLADLTVITSDNPRSEDPEAIIAQIETGAGRGGGAYLIEPDRRMAIRLALEEAKAGDVVLIAGKGHEAEQEFRDRTIGFDDRIVASEELAAVLENAP